MDSPYIYLKAAHIAFLALLVMSFAGLWLTYSKGPVSKDDKSRKRMMLFHAIALAGLFLTGFATLGIMKIKMGLWVWIKMGIWLVLGGLPVAYRLLAGKKNFSLLWWIPILVVAIISLLVNTKI